MVSSLAAQCIVQAYRIPDDGWDEFVALRQGKKEIVSKAEGEGYTIGRRC